ncbi:MAG: hypothetical protein U9N63_05580 [Pseudomonadota bacterium]|nr:hypothetical protein [Pseudomonadota bacterium]
MGSGKSETSRWLTKRLKREELKAHLVGEAYWPHPTRVITDLKQPLSPWHELPASELAQKSLVKWRDFVDETLNSDSIAVFDGQLFHGDLTTLMMMEIPFAEIQNYILQLEQELARLNPLLIYLYQTDIEKALHKICTQRDPQWQKMQFDWKLSSPYCQGRGFSGMTGYVDFYKEYRTLTDKLFSLLKIDKLSLENQAEDWPSIYAEIESFVMESIMDAGKNL